MGHFLLSAAEGEVILCDGSDEEWTGHESHGLIFLNNALTFTGFSLSVFINQQLTNIVICHH